MAGVPSRPFGVQTPRFVREFLLRPRSVGAIAPSSRALARRMVEGLELGTAGTVIEFGPGTGAFTAEILRRISPRTRFFAIERSPDMAREFRRRFPTVTLYEASAADVVSISQSEGVAPGTVDCIVSGLPFASFPDKLQRDILEGAVAMLKPGGKFVTFTYHVSQIMASSKNFRHILGEYFAAVERSRGVMLNLPSAFVYRCRTPG